MIASVVAAGILRSYFLNYVMSQTYDSTWYTYKIWIWTLVELYVAMVAASAPALKPFFRRYFIEPITSQGSKQPGSNEPGLEKRPYAATNGPSWPSLSTSDDEEKGDASWNNASGTEPGSVEGNERMGMAGTHELTALPSARVEGTAVDQVGPVLPLSVLDSSPAAARGHPGSGTERR